MVLLLRVPRGFFDQTCNLLPHGHLDRVGGPEAIGEVAKTDRRYVSVSVPLATPYFIPYFPISFPISQNSGGDKSHLASGRQPSLNPLRKSCPSSEHNLMGGSTRRYGGEQVWRYSSVTVWRGVCLTRLEATQT